jgi:hypothetical protein
MQEVDPVTPVIRLGRHVMARYSDEVQAHANSDAKDRRKLRDQRRMEFRRAIEYYAEQRLLQQELADYPELIAANYLATTQAVTRQSAQPVR